MEQLFLINSNHPYIVEADSGVYNSTMLITNGSQRMEVSSSKRIFLENIHIDRTGGEVKVLGGKLGKNGTTKIVNIQGDLYRDGGSSEVSTENLFVTGNLKLLNGAQITAETIVVGGNITDVAWNAGINVTNAIYVLGQVQKGSNRITGNLLLGGNNGAPEFPDFPNLEFPEIQPPEFFADYSGKGQSHYKIPAGENNGLRYYNSGNIFLNHPDHQKDYIYNEFHDVIIVSETGDINIFNSVNMSGILYAPKGRIKLTPGTGRNFIFRGVMFARDGVYIDDGNVEMLFKNINDFDFINSIDDYPFIAN